MIAAQRVLTVETDRGPVAVTITVDVPVLDRNAWRCDFSIGWPEGERRHHGMGVDSVQALHLALQTIAVHLYASPYHKGGKLFFDQPGNGYGFPLPPGGRDQAVGDDQHL